MKKVSLLFCVFLMMAACFVVDVYADEVDVGWVADENGWRYIGEMGAVSDCEYTVGENTYRFDDSGYLVTGIFENDGKSYYYTENAETPEEGLGAKAQGKVEINGRLYFFGEDYSLVTGWQTLDDKTYYFSEEDGSATTELSKINGKYYFFDLSGVMQTDWQKIHGKRYYFTADGSAAVGLTKIDGSFYCFNNSGKMLTGWHIIGKKRYYFKKNGIAQTGLKKIDLKYYLFDKKGEVCCGWRRINNRKLFFNKDGSAAVGLNKINSKYYYFSEKGTLLTSWRRINGNTYYFSPKGKGEKRGAALTGLRKIGKFKFFFDKKGRMRTGLTSIGKDTYAFSSTGKTGQKGRMLTGWLKTADGGYCYADSSGKLIKNSTFGGYDFDKNGRLTKESAFVKNTAQDIIKKYTKRCKSRSEKLYTVYKYVAATNRYQHLSLTKNEAYYASYIFKFHRGNCYAFASEFAFLARELGYDVKMIRGYCPSASGGWTPHAWCEIVMSGVTYIFDPELQYEIGLYGYKKTYATAGISYKK